MTKEELREHCEKQAKACEMWAEHREQEPSGKVYEEHKLILDLIKALEQEEYYKDLAQSYERTITKLTEAISERQPSEDCVSRQALLEFVESKYQSNWWNVDEVLAKIKSLPPVTHPHGTCKDCKFWTTDRAGSYCENLCVAFSKDFYCADFVKRGNK
jgi:hypothetical protein